MSSPDFAGDGGEVVPVVVDHFCKESAIDAVEGTTQVGGVRHVAFDDLDLHRQVDPRPVASQRPPLLATLGSVEGHLAAESPERMWSEI